eukprot:765106-Hanusia_phi.AAC.2
MSCKRRPRGAARKRRHWQMHFLPSAALCMRATAAVLLSARATRAARRYDHTSRTGWHISAFAACAQQPVNDGQGRSGTAAGGLRAQGGLFRISAPSASF